MLRLPAPFIDWASVNWLYLAVLAVFVFLSTLIGMLLAFKRAFVSALLSALLFSAAFVLWTYYPHGLPLPISVAAHKAPAPPAATPAAPATPRQSGDATLFAAGQLAVGSSPIAVPIVGAEAVAFRGEETASVLEPMSGDRQVIGMYFLVERERPR